MSEVGQGEWFTDSDGQWTWRQPDGTRWRVGSQGDWHQLEMAIPEPPHPGPPPGLLTDQLPSGILPGNIPPPGFAGAGIQGAAVPPPGFAGAGIHSGMLPGTVPGSANLSPSPELIHAQAQLSHPGEMNHGSGNLVGHSEDSGGLHEGNEFYHGDTGTHFDGNPDVRKEINPLAIWALFLGFLCLFYVGSIFAIVLGLEARHQIKHHRHSQRGTILAELGIFFAILWLCTIPILVIVGIDVYHGARTTVQDTKTKEVLNAALTGINDVEHVNHNYASINPSTLPNIPLVRFTPTCGTSGICMATGNGPGYSYMEMCQVSGSHHAWIIVQTSADSAWYGETSSQCPALGDPGSAAGQPLQSASWRQGGFPPVTLDITAFGHHFHWKL
ncbi:MAG TPA: DUF4190 domain-containing protein [Acidimicrobiales bacterium]|nr:DUF4190 domain-containing protein [Acidimicrobiales bacterium]